MSTSCSGELKKVPCIQNVAAYCTSQNKSMILLQYIYFASRYLIELQFRSLPPPPPTVSHTHTHTHTHTNGPKGVLNGIRERISRHMHLLPKNLKSVNILKLKPRRSLNVLQVKYYMCKHNEVTTTKTWHKYQKLKKKKKKKRH